MAGSPWTNQVVSLIVLTETAGYSGLFGYNGPPALGNLVLSSSTSTGTDAEGNAFLSGTTTYDNAGGGFFFATSMQGGFFAFYTASAAGGPWTLAGQINFNDAGQLNLGFTTTAIESLTLSGSLAVSTGASITGGLTVDTINGSSSTGGPQGTGFFNTQGLASGSYGSTHQHTLPDFPTATHTHGI